MASQDNIFDPGSLNPGMSEAQSRYDLTLRDKQKYQQKLNDLMSSPERQENPEAVDTKINFVIDQIHKHDQELQKIYREAPQEVHEPDSEKVRRPQPSDYQTAVVGVDRGMMGIPGGIARHLGSSMRDYVDQSRKLVEEDKPSNSTANFVAALSSMVPLYGPMSLGAREVPQVAGAVSRELPTASRMLSAAGRNAVDMGALQATGNALNDRPTTEGVGMASLIGGALGGVAEGVMSSAANSRNPLADTGGAVKRLEGYEQNKGRLEALPIYEGSRKRALTEEGTNKVEAIKQEETAAQKAREEEFLANKKQMEERQGFEQASTEQELAKRKEELAAKRRLEEFRSSEADRLRQQSIDNVLNARKQQEQQLTESLTSEQGKALQDQSVNAGTAAKESAEKESQRLREELNQTVKDMVDTGKHIKSAPIRKALKQAGDVGEATLGHDINKALTQVSKIVTESESKYGKGNLDAERARDILAILSEVRPTRSKSPAGVALNNVENSIRQGSDAGTALRDAMGQFAAQEKLMEEARSSLYGHGEGAMPMSYKTQYPMQRSAAKTMEKMAEPQAGIGEVAKQNISLIPGSEDQLALMSKIGTAQREQLAARQAEADKRLAAAKRLAENSDYMSRLNRFNSSEQNIAAASEMQRQADAAKEALKQRFGKESETLANQAKDRADQMANEFAQKVKLTQQEYAALQDYLHTYEQTRIGLSPQAIRGWSWWNRIIGAVDRTSDAIKYRAMPKVMQLLADAADGKIPGLESMSAILDRGTLSRALNTYEQNSHDVSREVASGVHKLGSSIEGAKQGAKESIREVTAPNVQVINQPSENPNIMMQEY